MVSARIPPYVLIGAAILVLGGSIATAGRGTAETGVDLGIANGVDLSLGLPQAVLPSAQDASSPAQGDAPALVTSPESLVSPPDDDGSYSIDSVGFEGIVDTAQGLAVDESSSKPLRRPDVPRYYFPALFNPEKAAATYPVSFGSGTDLSSPRVFDSAGPELPLLANNQVLAFYGHPSSRRMGILGEYSKEDLGKLLKGYAKLYDQANGPEGVVPAYYLIYGTCWPGGDIGYLKDSVVRDYVTYAASQGMIVYVDHQIGKYTVVEAMRRLLPWLKYPNVHLALDPEWRTTVPMEEIGSITAEEVNKAQEMMRDYMNAEGISGVRMLVIHQFRSSMILGRERVRADNDRVLLVHTADGFGPPALKKNGYALNALAGNMPLKGFKLFFKTKVPGAGFDDPLLTPPEVLSLSPRPVLVIYQ